MTAKVHTLGPNAGSSPTSGHNGAPPADQFDDRTKREIATDVASSAIYGTMRGVEVEFEGDLSVTGEAFVKSLRKFLGDVAESAEEQAIRDGEAKDRARATGARIADRYAKRLAGVLREFML